MHKTRLIFLVLLALLLTVWQGASANGVLQLGWATLGNGGGEMSGGSFALNGTVGQADSTDLSGGSFSISGGFWNPDNTVPTAVTLASDSTTVQPHQLLFLTAFLLLLVTLYFAIKEKSA